MSRLIWYVVFSLILLGVLHQVGAPDAVTGAYVVIAVVGFAMAVRDLRARAREMDDLARGFRAGVELNRARMAADQQAAQTQPWYEEVAATQDAAIVRGAHTSGLFTTFNPYWSVGLDSLVRHGLASTDEIETIAEIARSAPPEAWQNGFILSDLAFAGYTRQESLVRIGLFKAHEHRFAAAKTAEALGVVHRADTPDEMVDAHGHGVLTSEEVPIAVGIAGRADETEPRGDLELSGAPRLFLDRLASLGVYDWISIFDGPPTEKWDLDTDPIRTTMADLSKSTDAKVRRALALIPGAVEERVERSFPSIWALNELQSPMGDKLALDAEQYGLMRAQVLQRIALAALVVALPDQFDELGVAGAYRPFQGCVPLSDLGVHLQRVEFFRPV